MDPDLLTIVGICVSILEFHTLVPSFFKQITPPDSSITTTCPFPAAKPTNYTKIQFKSYTSS